MVRLGERRVDLIIREGGILDAHLENLLKGRYGPGAGLDISKEPSLRGFSINASSWRGRGRDREGQ